MVRRVTCDVASWVTEYLLRRWIWVGTWERKWVSGADTQVKDIPERKAQCVLDLFLPHGLCMFEVQQGECMPCNWVGGIEGREQWDARLVSASGSPHVWGGARRPMWLEWSESDWGWSEWVGDLRIGFYMYFESWTRYISVRFIKQRLKNNSKVFRVSNWRSGVVIFF